MSNGVVHMSIEEAIDAMKFYRQKLYNGVFNDKIQAFDIAIMALEKLVPAGIHPDGDENIIACPYCGSGEYLCNEDGNDNAFCGQCGKALELDETDSKLVEIDQSNNRNTPPDPNNPCFGCCHYDQCGYFDYDWSNTTEEEKFEEHCVGCCCGNGFECNRDNGGCVNYETEPRMG